MREDENFDLDEGLTFKKVWKFLKTAIPYILICVLVCVMVGVAAVATISEIDKKTNESVHAVFELTYDKAEEGLTPDGKQLDIQKVKSLSNISKAMSNLSLNFSSSEIQTAITINGYYSKHVRQMINSLGGDSAKILELVENMGLNFTQFEVNFNYKIISGLNSYNAVSIIEEILKIAKIESFYVTSDINFLSSMNYDDPKLKALSNIDKLYFLNSEVFKINNYLNNSNKVNETNKVIMKSAIQETLLAIDEASYFVLSKGLFVIEDIITLDSQINKVDRSIVSLKSKITGIETRIVEQTAVISEMIKNLNIVINDKGEIVNGSYVTELYNEQYRRLNKLQDEKALFENDLSMYSDQKAILDALKASNFEKPDPKAVEEANKKIELIFNSVKSLVAQMELNVSDVSENQELQYGMNITLAPIQTYASAFTPSWLKCVLISAIVGIFLGLALTYPINKVLSKKSKKKNLIAQSANGVVAEEEIDSIEDKENK